MTSSNGNIFRVTGPLCGEFTGPGEFPARRPVTRGFDVFFDLRLNKQLSKQPWGWWFETPSWSLWRQCNDMLWIKFMSTPYVVISNNSNFEMHPDLRTGMFVRYLTGITLENNKWIYIKTSLFQIIQRTPNSWEKDAAETGITITSITMVDCHCFALKEDI